MKVLKQSGLVVILLEGKLLYGSCYTFMPFMRRARNSLCAKDRSLLELQNQDQLAVLFLSKLEESSQILLTQDQVFDEACANDPEALGLLIMAYNFKCIPGSLFH